MGKVFLYCAYVVAVTALAITSLSMASPFGSREGALGLVPWLLPTLIGTPAIVFLQRHYRKQFGDLAAG